MTLFGGLVLPFFIIFETSLFLFAGHIHAKDHVSDAAITSGINGPARRAGAKQWSESSAVAQCPQETAVPRGQHGLCTQFLPRPLPVVQSSVSLVAVGMTCGTTTLSAGHDGTQASHVRALRIQHHSGGDADTRVLLDCLCLIIGEQMCT